MVYNFRKRTLRERLLEEEDEDETVAEEVSDNEDYVSEISDDSDDDETGNEEEIKIEDSERKIKNFALSKKLRHSNARGRFQSELSKKGYAHKSNRQHLLTN